MLLRRWGKAGNGWIIVGDGESESFEEYAEGQTIPQHGTHLSFGDDLPASAMSAGADMAAVSMLGFGKQRVCWKTVSLNRPWTP